MKNLKTLLKTHPHWGEALELIMKIQQAGGEALFAGGSVRDALVGLAPKDLDLATSLQASELKEILPGGLEIGKSFGVFAVPSQNGGLIEIASFRKEGPYVDGRHPSSIEAASLEEDADRRDFTMNACYFDPVKNQLFDFHEGSRHISEKRIVCVGNSRDRMREDFLRSVRAIRFQSRFGFEFDSALREILPESLVGLKKISQDRIWQELQKIEKAPFQNMALQSLTEFGGLEIFFGFCDQDVEVLFFTFISEVSIQRGLKWSSILAILGALCLESKKDVSMTELTSALPWPSRVKAQGEWQLQNWRLTREGSWPQDSWWSGLERLDPEYFEWSALLEEFLYGESKLSLAFEGLAKRFPEVLRAERTWPPSLLKGESLMKLGLKGEGLGRALRRVRALQLNGELNSSQQALNWVRMQVEEGPL